MNKYKITSLLLAILLMTSCAVKYVADYDQNIVDSILNTSKMIDQFYMKLYRTNDNERTFGNFQKDYQDIEVEINLLIHLNNMQENNELSIKNAENISKNWQEIKIYHQSMNNYKLAIAEEDREIILGQLIELLKKEYIKKWGEKWILIKFLAML